MLKQYFRIKKLLTFIPGIKAKRQFIFIAILSCISGTLDILGIASLLPVLFITINEQAIKENALISQLYGFFNFSSRQQFIYVVIALFLMLIIIKNMVGLLISYIQYKYAYKTGRSISGKIFLDYFNKGFLFVTNAQHVDLWRDLMVNPYVFSSGILLPFFLLISELWVIFLIVAAISFYNYQILLLVLITILPLTIFFYIRVKNKVQTLGEEKNRIYSTSNKVILNTLNGFSTILLMQKQYFFRKDYLQKRKALDKNEILTALFNLMPLRVIELITMLSIMSVLVYFIVTDTASAYIITSLGVFGASAYRLLPSINRIISSLIKIKNSSFVFSVLERFETDSGLKQINEKNEQKIKFEKKISIEHISFSYPKKSNNVINNLSLSIPKGACIGIVGESGAGKSTLVNLLLRFVTEKEGELKVDGIRINKDNENAWRKIIGYVPQDVFVMDEPLVNNIAFGLPDEQAELKKVNLALQQAMLIDFLNSLSNGLDTSMGESGSRISGGQKQRIGIARTLYRQADFLILDEITSSLDTETERSILETLSQLKKTGKTILIIAHRPSTLKYCDLIYKIENGTIKTYYTFSEYQKQINQ